MDNKACILNYAWVQNNYGAVLTAYALVELLKDKFNLQGINLNNKNIEYLNTQKNIKNITPFKDKYINFTDFCSKYTDFKNLNNVFNTFIVGSDQIFRAGCLGKYLYQYYLDFVDLDKKKISFSASFGVDKEQFLKETPKHVIEKVKRSLQLFDFVSVRENSGVEICRDVFNVKAEWIIDPVFIIDKLKYEELTTKATEDYAEKIVSYVLDTSKEYDNAYKHFEQKYNTQVIKTANSDLTIENWLSAIKNCKFLITDSFHGMCFAIIFNKPFICLSNKKRGATRFESVLELLGIENLCISKINEIYDKDCIFKPDYDIVNQKIEQEAKKGIDFLEKALAAPVEITPEKMKIKTEILEERICELETSLTISNQIKFKLWNIWRVIYHRILPNEVKNIIKCFWKK